MRKLMLSLSVIAVLASASAWAENQVFIRQAQLPSISNFAPVEPVAVPVPGVFDTGAKQLPPVGFIDPGMRNPIDPLKPIETDVFGTGGLYDWLFPPEGGNFDSALCPWKQ